MSLRRADAISLDALPPQGVIEGSSAARSQGSAGFEAFGDAPLAAAPGDAPTGLPMGPVSLNAQTGMVRMTINVGFSCMQGDASCTGNVTSWSFDDVTKAVNDADLRKQLRENYAPKLAVPVSLAILGTNLGENENLFALQVFDNSSPTPKALHTTTAFKSNTSDRLSTSGFPLYLLKSGYNNVLLKSPEMKADHVGYWKLNMSMLDKDVTSIHLPGHNMEYAIIKRDSQAANMANYALSIKNSVVVPPLLENPQFTYASDPRYVQMSMDMYNDVKRAYGTKMAEIQAGAYDLSKLSVKLTPLPGVPASKLEAIDNAFVSMELVAHMGFQGDAESNAAMSDGLFETGPSAVNYSGDFMQEI